MNYMYSNEPLLSILNNKLSLCWLKNGLISLGVAGIYSIVLVILRTPQFSSIIANTDIFKSALVIHVNLSVLVWLLSITSVIWSSLNALEYFGKILCRFALLGSIIMGISPFCAENLPVMNNYIPMLENLWFVVGLSIFGISTLLFALSIFFSSKNSCSLVAFSSSSSAFMFIMVFVCFTLSYFKLEKILEIVPINIDFYYELLYWSGGHLLQFVYVQILIIVWIILLKLNNNNSIFSKAYFGILVLNFTLSLLALLGHFFYDIIDAEFKEYYTNHMKYAGGIAPILTILVMSYQALSEKKELDSYIKASMIGSIGLFLSGGVIGLLISGVNVTIPAHYHGSIVGISLAFMGFAYLLFESCNCNFNKRWATVQLYVITAGQILHITGLSIAGGYGVLRKTTGAVLSIKAKLALGLMGGGGLIAIIGGLMFVFICGRCLVLIHNRLDSN